MSQKKQQEEKQAKYEAEIRHAKLPRGKQVFGIVNQRLGGTRMNVRCLDSKTRLCRIPGRLKRRLWVREGRHRAGGALGNRRRRQRRHTLQIHQSPSTSGSTKKDTSKEYRNLKNSENPKFENIKARIAKKEQGSLSQTAANHFKMNLLTQKFSLNKDLPV